MQCSKKEGYLSPLLLTVGLFVHQVPRSRVVVDVPYSLGHSVSYTDIMDFEKSAAVSTAVFDSSSEIESQELFKQFIADNFDHNKDTTTGDNITHVMGIISCETPKLEYMKSQPIKRMKILSGY